MHFFKTALSLALLAGSALAQSTLLTLPLPNSKLTASSKFVVQVGMGSYPENVDVVAIVLGLEPCLGGTCNPPSSLMGQILYQGPHTPQPGHHYVNYTVTVPEGFPTGEASLNVLNLFMAGAENAPGVDYLSENVTVVA